MRIVFRKGAYESFLQLPIRGVLFIKNDLAHVNIQEHRINLPFGGDVRISRVQNI